MNWRYPVDNELFTFYSYSICFWTNANNSGCLNILVVVCIAVMAVFGKVKLPSAFRTKIPNPS